MKKKVIGIILSSIMALGLFGCGQNNSASIEPTESAEENIVQNQDDKTIAANISLWTYPVGSWGDEAALKQIISNFNQNYPNISVEVKLLDYSEGDATVQAAIDEGNTPDIVMEGPERLVSNWGASGLMIPLNSLWDNEAVEDISSNNLAVLAACIGTDGNYYEYPLCMNAHCMAINKEVFEASGAMQYIDQTTRTWTVEGFEKAMQALKDYGVETTGIVYCGGQGGDQGTRALAMNLYNAQFTNGAHTKWMMDSDTGIQGIAKLVDWCNQGLLSYDPTIVASDELSKFAAGESMMSFCWNASNRANYAEQVNFTPYAVAFPSEDGIPELAGGIYGFGIFDNGDATRAEAAKLFIKYVCDDKVQGPDSVRASGFFPVRSSFGDVYKGTEKETSMAEFASFMTYLGDYYNVIPGWADQRTAWWTMLQKAFAGNDVETVVKEYVNASNEATNQVLRK